MGKKKKFNKIHLFWIIPLTLILILLIVAGIISYTDNHALEISKFTNKGWADKICLKYGNNEATGLALDGLSSDDANGLAIICGKKGEGRYYVHYEINKEGIRRDG